MEKYKVKINTTIKELIKEVAKVENASEKQLYRLFKKYTADNGDMYSKGKVLQAYRKFKKEDKNMLSQKHEDNFLKNIKMKKIRTISGVTPVTVLTKPFPCPGKCVFCPNDVRMPKSYLMSEPGAQRAYKNKFDPYLQTYNRLLAFRNTGHNTDKIELLILGGTWSSYPESYQIWFVKRCFDAMNDFTENPSTVFLDSESTQMPFEEQNLVEINGERFEKTYNQVISKAILPKIDFAQKESATWDELFKAHKVNETAKTRCIGLVIETRPDEIDYDEVLRIRKLGATKVQIGIQSLDESVLSKNKRGHNVEKTKEAINLLRQAGFKIHAHWMPNLLGSSPEKDKTDFTRLFSDESIRPDELKIYPCSLIESAELMKFYKKDQWYPYSQDELLDVVTFALENTPRYCRISRVIRDIPSTDIVTGNKITNFRQVAQNTLKKRKIKISDIRSREVKDKQVSLEQLNLKVTQYDTSVSSEYFIEFITKGDEIAGFLRLSLPSTKLDTVFNELKACTIIREIHVYGESIKIGAHKSGKAQHIGLGKRLIKKAEEISLEKGFKKIAVISSIGTRKYYTKNGFKQKGLYQVKELA